MEESLITSKCNYNRLNELLAAAKWQEADRETLQVMLKVAEREQETWLDTKSMENFPCEDLSIIDQLWIKHSNGHFGFSVQKRIYESLGVSKQYDELIWKAFAESVGWRSEKHWLYYEECWYKQLPFAPICSLTIDIEGWHVLRKFWCGGESSGVLFSSLVSKLANCNI